MPKENCEPREVSNRSGVRFIAHKVNNVWYAYAYGLTQPVQTSETLEGLRLRLNQFTAIDIQRMTAGSSIQSSNINVLSNDSIPPTPNDRALVDWVYDALRGAGFRDPPILYISEALNIARASGRQAAIHFIEDRRQMFLPPSSD